MNKIPLIVIAGPTASGKTSLGISVAKHLGGEIISADSMQIYKFMDIGTAKPTLEETEGVPHHMISVIEPDQSFSVADYVKSAKTCIEDIYNRGKLPIVVGGTGLYIDSLVQNRQFVETIIDQELRKRLTRIVEESGADKLYSMLCKIDRQAAEKIAPQNIKRVIRAIEIYETTGLTLTQQNEKSRGEQIYNAHCFAVGWEREKLYERIDKRVDIMMKDGLISEVCSLKNMGFDKNLNSMQGIGYKQTFWYLEGLLTATELSKITKKDSRRYAKRQLTWFKKDDKIQWIENTNDNKLRIIEDSVNAPAF